jgi:hypothetical protein
LHVRDVHGWGQQYSGCFGVGCAADEHMMFATARLTLATGCSWLSSLFFALLTCTRQGFTLRMNYC